MALVDSLNDIMEQTDNYVEQDVNNKNVGKSEPINKPKMVKNNNRSFKKESPKMFLLIGGAIIAIIIFAVFISMNNEPAEQEYNGADFLYDEEIYRYKYNLDEREMLRNYGYTADDIERAEAEEKDPYALVQETIEIRQRIYEDEMAPYKNSVSPEFQELLKNTWVGGDDMDSSIISNPDLDYSNYTGVYNLDYIKIPAKGGQLFLKLEWLDYNQSIFMSVQPKVYASLLDSGNIVVEIDYQVFDNDSICVIDVKEVSIQN